MASMNRHVRMCSWRLALSECAVRVCASASKRAPSEQEAAAARGLEGAETLGEADTATSLESSRTFERRQRHDHDCNNDSQEALAMAASGLELEGADTSHPSLVAIEHP